MNYVALNTLTNSDINCNLETELNGKIPRIDTFSSLIKTLEGALHDMSGLYLHFPSVVDWIVDCLPIIYRCLSVVSLWKWRRGGSQGLNRAVFAGFAHEISHILNYLSKRWKLNIFGFQLGRREIVAAAHPHQSPLKYISWKGAVVQGQMPFVVPRFFSSFLGAIQMILKFVNADCAWNPSSYTRSFTFKCMKVRNFYVRVCTFTLQHWNAAKSFFITARNWISGCSILSTRSI